MKKFTKVCLILALFFVVIGLGCFIVGSVKGGSLIEAIKHFSGNVLSYAEDFDKEIDKSRMELKESFDIDEIEKLQVDIGFGAVVVQPVSGDSCHVWVQEKEGSIRDEVEVSLQNNTLLIQDDAFGQKNHFWNFNLWNFKLFASDLKFKKGCLVVVELPKKELGSLDAVIQAGACKIYDVSAHHMDIQVECGNVYGQGTQSCRNMNINVDMGNAILEHLECERLEANVDMGNFEVSKISADSAKVNAEMGHINMRQVKTPHLEADCEMGNIVLQMEGEPSDYYIESDVEMGDIDIEERSSTKDRTAKNKMELSCEMGNIEVSFR